MKRIKNDPWVTVFVSMSTEQLVVQLGNFHRPKIRQVAPKHHHILLRLVAHDLEADHDNLVVDMAVEVDVVGDIRFEEGLEDILDYMLAVLSAVHVRVALIEGIVHIALEADNLLLDRKAADLELVAPLVVLHMPVDPLVEDMTFSLNDEF